MCFSNLYELCFTRLMVRRILGEWLISRVKLSGSDPSGKMLSR